MALTHTPEAELGKKIPEFYLPVIHWAPNSKSKSSMAQTKDFLNNKPLVVMFICNHCPYVKAIEDRLITLATDCFEMGVHTVGICSNDPVNYPDDSFENLKIRSTEKNYSFTYLHDPDQKVAKLFDAVCTPDFFVYDSHAKLAYRGRLDDSWKDPSHVTNRELFNAVKKLVANEPLNEKQTPSMGCSIKWS